MNLKTNNKGFTLIELLIVIVVIAILAAISVVAYTGFQNRAKTSTGQQLAAQVESKAQAYYTVKSSYPTSFNDFDGVPEAKLEGLSVDSPNATGNTVKVGTASGFNQAAAKNGKTINYESCNSGGGARISYWDFTASDSSEAKVDKVLGTC